MRNKQDASCSYTVMSIWMVIGLMLLAYNEPAGLAQQTTESLVEEGGKSLIAQLHGLPQGRVIAESGSTNVVGRLTVTGYRVEEIKLPQAATVKVGGRNRRVNRAWRITLKGGPFSLRAMPASLYIDGVLVGFGIESPLLDEISFYTINHKLLKDGAALSLTYGVGSLELSDKLNLRDSLKRGESDEETRSLGNHSRYLFAVQRLWISDLLFANLGPRDTGPACGHSRRV